MNARYWGHLARRYQKREMGIKIFLAATSSATVAGWVLWKHAPLLWQVLSGISALLAIALPILNYSQRIATMADLRAKWMHLRVEYDRLWAEQGSADLFGRSAAFRAQGGLGLAPLTRPISAARWEETPHLSRTAGHPLPLERAKGGGLRPSLVHDETRKGRGPEQVRGTN